MSIPRKNPEQWEVRNCKQCKEDYEAASYRRQFSQFCSILCQINWWKSHGQNDKIKKLKGKIINCECCGIEQYFQPKQIEKNEHFFCSEECRQKWYAEIYSQSEEFKNTLRCGIVQRLEEGKYSSTKTGCQLIVNDILDSLGVKYINDYNLTFYSIDNYLIEDKLGIEVMGTFWHTDPRYYEEIIYEMQSRGVKSDKSKFTYLQSHHNLKLLYLWEYDILNNIELCKELIKLYIDRNGILQDYNSFNYITDENNDFQLVETKIVPYFMLSSKQIKEKKNLKDTKSKIYIIVNIVEKKKNNLQYITIKANIIFVVRLAVQNTICKSKITHNKNQKRI